MIFLDFKDSRPIYEQIVDKYKTLILRGVLAPGEQMTSVRRLAMELSANPNTVQRAYAELEREGFLYSVKGKGSFVCGDDSLKEARKEELRDRLRRILAEAEEIGISPSEILEGIDKEDRHDLHR